METWESTNIWFLQTLGDSIVVSWGILEFKGRHHFLEPWISLYMSSMFGFAKFWKAKSL